MFYKFSKRGGYEIFVNFLMGRGGGSKMNTKLPKNLLTPHFLPKENGAALKTYLVVHQE